MTLPPPASLWDATPPASQRAPATSHQAAASMRQPAKALRPRVLAYFIRRGAAGATAEEMAEALDLPTQTATPRVRELLDAGLLRDSGRRRPTRSGRSARVLVAMEGATPSQSRRD